MGTADLEDRELEDVPEWVTEAQREIDAEEGADQSRALDKIDEPEPDPEPPEEPPEEPPGPVQAADQDAPPARENYDQVVRQRDAILNEVQTLRQTNREKDQRYEMLLNAVRRIEERLGTPDEEDPYEEEVPGWAKGLIERVETRDQQEQAARTIQMLEQKGLADEEAFRQETPDYDDAAAFVRDYYTRHYQAQGITDPQVLQDIEGRMKAVAAARAHQAGQNVAATVYAHARELGYTPKEAEAAAQAADPAPPASPAQPKKPPVSLSQVGGSSGVKRRSLTDLMEEDPDEFDKIANDERSWRRWMQQSATS